MATLAQLIPRIFNHAWQRYGEPTLTAVRPIAYWVLPAGFAYNKDVDAIRDSAGVVLTNVSDYWTSDSIHILPTKSAPGGGDVAELQALPVPGVAQTGEVSVWVLKDDIHKLRVAHALLLGDQWYDLVSQQQAPAGFPDSTGLWARVRLRGR
jgi:hypothetical protein